MNRHVPDAVDAALAAANVMLRVAARSIVAVEDRVTTPQLRVLTLIEAAGPRNMVDVAAELGVHPSNATRTCDRLVRAGLITRTPHTADRRYVRLELTAAGRDLIEHVLRERREAIAAVFASMPDVQREAVGAALGVFAEAAGEGQTLDGRFTLGLG